MKMKYLKLVPFAAVLAFTACGGNVETAEDSLDQLKSKRDSLKAELALLNEQIALMDTTAENALPLVSAESVLIEEFVHKVEVQGNVETDENALINAEASGTITVIHVKEGQKVSKGQALITIDSQILQSTIEEVETSLELATYMFEKQQQLMDEGVGIELEYEQAKNNKKALEKKLNTMRSQRGKSVVRAPFSGVIDDIFVSVGELAAPQFPLLRVVNNREVSITASMSESLLAFIKVGTPVDLVIPSLNDTVIQSKVTFKGNFIDPVNRTFKIRVDIKNNSLLIPNQLAKVSVTDFIQADATVINSEAILQDTENNNYIYKLVDDAEGGFGVKKVYIKVIKRYNGKASVQPVGQGKLDQNDRVVVKGAKGITESDRVELI